MASAVVWLAPCTKETTNYARLCRLLVDGGTKALRHTFDTFHPPAALCSDLTHPSNHLKLQSLRKKRILNATQWGKLYPATPATVRSEDFDITLLMLLLRNTCPLTIPATGWDSLPLASDASVEANIARVKYYRNEVYGHASQASIDDPTFTALWLDISNVLIELGVDATTINKLKTDTMDPVIEEHYQKLLKEWKEDEANIRDKLVEMEGTYDCIVQC